MRNNNILVLAGTILALGGAVPQDAAAQAGPGASVEWTAGPGAEPTVFFDSPDNFDKHYRVCIKKPAQGTTIEVVLADRTITIFQEECIDVISNKISVRMTSGTEPATGIFFLVE